MAWPSLTDYQDAIQNPQTCFDDAELKAGAPALDKFGIPLVVTGGFASVYRVASGDRVWAIRCFLREYGDQQRRYTAIAEHLSNARLPYTVGFNYLRTGIRVQGAWYPVLKMDWVDGVPLNQYIASNLTKPDVLLALAEDWRSLISEMQNSRFAHGDLQHGNILIHDSKIKLIDYDAMFVPSLAGIGSHEQGHTSYQDPRRSEKNFDLSIDNFSSLVIYLGILSLAWRPELWDRHDNGDNILFCRDDLLNFGTSPLVKEIRNIDNPAIVECLITLEQALQRPVGNIPPITELKWELRGSPTDKGKVSGRPSWIYDPTVTIEDSPQLAGALAFSFELAWRRPGTREEKHARQVPIYGITKKSIIRYRDKKVPFKVFGFTIKYNTEKESYVEEVEEKYIQRYRDEYDIVTVEQGGHRGRVSSVCITDDGRMVASGGDDGYIYVWDANSGDLKRKLGPHRSPISGLATGISDYLASASWDQSLKLWNIGDSSSRTFSANSRFYDASFSPDGTLLAGALGRMQIPVWHIRSGNQIASLKGHTRRVTCLRFLPDGRRLISGSADMSIRVWNVIQKESTQILYGHSDEVTAICCSSDGSLVVSAGADGIILVWELSNGRQLMKVNTRHGVVHSIAFTNDGRAIISAGQDGVIRFWDSRNGRLLSQVAGHLAGVRDIAMSSDGQRLASGGDDGYVMVWERNRSAQDAAPLPKSSETKSTRMSVASGIPSKPQTISQLQCPLCGRSLVRRSGRFGEFLGCSGFPSCHYTRNG